MTAIADVLALLREAGGRVTTARRAVIEALLDGPAHLTAEDLAARVQRRHPEIHLSTVYRTLETLAELGVVTHVHLGHGRAVFHVTGDAHRHLVCSDCGAVIEAPSELFDDLTARIRRKYGFALQPDHFALLGRCRDCRN